MTRPDLQRWLRRPRNATLVLFQFAFDIEEVQGKLKRRLVLVGYWVYGLLRVRERVNYLRWHFGNEVGRRWWNHVKGDYPDEFREYVDKILTKDSLSENRKMIDALMPSETRSH